MTKIHTEKYQKTKVNDIINFYLIVTFSYLKMVEIADCICLEKVSISS